HSASARYNGIPNTILNGNVTPSDAANESAGFASGTDSRIAAGTAIYEQLAARIPSIAVPPTDSPSARPSTHPTTEANSGNAIPNTTINNPYFRRLPTAVAASNPI